MPIPLLITPLLTSLASSGMSLLANAIKTKGKEVIEDKLGIKIPDDAAQLTPELLAELKRAEMEHEEFLIDAQIRHAELELRELETHIGNTKDARNLGVELSKSTSLLNQNIMPVLALVVMFGGTAILLLSIEADVRMAAVSMMTLVLGYFFGSSQGSKTANERLSKMSGGS